jgi:pimeloyl-ACP methyl ester carboxylesterase
MNRRNALFSVAGAGLATACAARAAANDARPATAARSASRRQVIARDGTHLFHRDWGDGKPVVFLIGWTLTSESWAYQAAELSDRGLRCIAYDRRGHGRSDDPGHGYDLDTLADDLAALIETLDLREVTLVAHSFGALEATRYLSRHGADRVARVVYLAPVGPCLMQKPDNPQGAPRAYFEQNWARWRADFPAWVDDNADPYFTPGTSDGVKAWTKAQMVQCSMRATLDLGRTMADADIREELARIKVPTLIIHGDKDASAPLELTGRRMAALVPGARLTVYEGAPHGLYFTHMDRLNADLLAFARP